MTAAVFEGQYKWHPAADDRRLAQACVDVRAGRYLSASETLKDARWDFDLRSHRSLVLASEAADSDLTERWLAEVADAESALMWARVAVLRVTRMAATDDPRLIPLVRIAMAACERAAEEFPEDPTPWVAQLSMARLLHYRDPAPHGMMLAPPGPWSLFSRILSLDPWNREAHHRMLPFFFERNGGSKPATWDVAHFLGQRAPVSSPLRLLPLVALVEDHDPKALLADHIWQQPAWRTTAANAYHNWFPDTADYRFTPVLDLSYLAHALFMANLEFEARAVLTAMGPYAARMPWSTFGHAQQQLTRARRLCGLGTPEKT
ncbi:hypothetical protein [Streptomyces fulvoviolaceus]|uniref:hypothetical protein n=1 Tax=Streptomyces fulvoviolaceus TaxID=285535 RepID=UPI0009965651|nr:hypothetical protein [Streptomyces fulvoviolaceus]